VIVHCRLGGRLENFTKVRERTLDTNGVASSGVLVEVGRNSSLVRPSASRHPGCVISVSSTRIVIVIGPQPELEISLEELSRMKGVIEVRGQSLRVCLDVDAGLYTLNLCDKRGEPLKGPVVCRIGLGASVFPDRSNFLSVFVYDSTNKDHVLDYQRFLEVNRTIFRV